MEARAAKYEDKLKSHEDEFKSQYGQMSDSVVNELTKLNNIIIDHIVGHEQFTSYLKNVFEALQKYAGKYRTFETQQIGLGYSFVKGLR